LRNLEVSVRSNLKMAKKKITKDMTFMELMDLDSEAGNKLAERGLFCGGCPMAQFESIENGAKAHGVDVDELLKELNKQDE
jgi:hybrid cluster-associated redox disulfide protein